jgi:hypothetical protein
MQIPHGDTSFGGRAQRSVFQDRDWDPADALDLEDLSVV